jgi:hypothetical protein
VVQHCCTFEGQSCTEARCQDQLTKPTGDERYNKYDINNGTTNTTLIMAPGRDDEAAKAVSQLQRLDPTCTISTFRDFWPLRRERDQTAFEKGLLPE